MENGMQDKGFFGNKFFGKRFIATVETTEDATTALPRNPRQGVSTIQIQKTRQTHSQFFSTAENQRRKPR